MDSLRRTLAVASFEARLMRRFWRVWILGILALIFPLIQAAQYLVIHRLFSGFSGPYAFMTRDVWVLQSAVLLSLTLGVFGVFYAFDWRHRDESFHFEATYDASSLGRLELAWGKFLGLAVVLLAPYSVLVVAQVVGLLVADVRVPLSVFLLNDVLFGMVGAVGAPALAFGLAGLTGSRLVAILGGLGITALALGAAFALPEEVAVVAGALVEIPVHSDFIGYEISGLTLLQRVSAVLLVLFAVSLAACGRLGLPRRPAERSLVLGVAAAFGALWLASMGGSWLLYRGALNAREAVIAAERTVAGAPTATVTRRDIEVAVDPGESLEATARLGLRNDGSEPLRELALRLNAGLLVRSASLDGRALTVDRDLTVIRLQLGTPLAPGATAELALDYAGSIDLPSVDAEEVLKVTELNAQTRNNRRFLGSMPAVFEAGAVMLGLDAAWHPTSGVLFGHEYPERWEPSFAPGSLTVTVPDGWRVASTGSREDLGGGRYRFVTEEAVPGLPLVAAAYEEASAEVEGIVFRVLYHPLHARNIEFFEAAAPRIRERIGERLDEIRARTGLGYPHPEFTLCEVPQQVAAYSAGWDTPNRLGAPGVVMLREGGLFGARFEFAFQQARKQFERESGGGGDDEGGLRVSVSVDGEPLGGDAASPPEGEPEAAVGDEEPPATDDAPAAEEGEPAAVDEPADQELARFDEAGEKLRIAARFVDTDWAGGHLQRLALRSFWDHRLHAAGAAAPVLGHALPSYVAEAALGHVTVDSPEVVQIFSNQAFGQLINATTQGRDSEMAEIVINAITDLDEIHATIQDRALAELDPHEDPTTFLGVLHVKGRLPLHALRDTLGRERWNRVLAGLLEHHAGGAYSWSDFSDAVLEEAPAEWREEIAVLLDHWLTGTALPGFVTTRTTAQRLASEDEAWQVIARVANRGDVAGTAKLVVSGGGDEWERLFAVGPGADVEVGLVVPRKPEGWRLVPYLALNRDHPRGTLAPEEDPVDAEPFVGTRPAEILGEGEPVVVDNVDEGFSVTLDDGETVAYADRDDEDERHLRAWNGFRPPSEWQRWRSQGRWYRPFGFFDPTAAVKRGDEEGEHPARWQAILPEGGRWRVEVFLPAKSGRGERILPERYHFVVRGGDGASDVALDLDAAEAGWNDLGRFVFDAEAEVLLLDRGDGLVVADAVRFVKEAS